MTSRTLRHGAALLGFLFALTLAWATPVKFDIPKQPVASAIKAFIKQSKAQVAYRSEELEGLTANEVKGEFEAAAALEAMLKDTGCAIVKRDSGIFVVTKAVAPITTGSVRGVLTGEGGKGMPNVLISIRETSESAETNRFGEYVFPKIAAGTYVLVASASGYQTMHIADVQVRAGRELTIGKEEMRKAKEGPLALEPFVVKADTVTELDPYEVTGAKVKPFSTANMDIPRTINDAQPYYIFDAKTIDTSGATNVEDFLKQQLTMNSVALTNKQDALSIFGNTSSINLRGLGTDKTLILVNGRRMAGINYTTSSVNQTDLNGIPLSAIDRIEVLPSSASGIYGGGAIGGVVNVVLKRDYAGGELRVTYDNTWDKDAPRRSVSLSYGLPLEGGKTHLSLNAAWSDTSAVLLQDRVNIFRQNVTTIRANAPTYIGNGSSNAWLGVLPNILPSSASLATLTLKSGNTPLGSRRTFVPAGTSANTSVADRAAGLLANAGQWNLEFPSTYQSPTGLLRSLGSEPETKSFQASFRRLITRKIELFAEAAFRENRTYSVGSYLNSVPLVVRANAPTNPFTTDVRVQIPAADEVPRTTSSASRSATIGVRMELPRLWVGNLDYSWSQSRLDYFNFGTDTTARTADLLSGVLNPFVDTLLYPLNLKKYAMPFTYHGSSRLHDLNFRAGGPLPSLPWGAPTLTIGVGHRIAKTPEQTFRLENPITLAESYEQKYYARESTTDSAYLEALAPLIKSAWVAGIHSLDLQISGRTERYRVDAGTDSEQNFFNRTPPATVYGNPTLDGVPYFAKANFSSTNGTVGLRYMPVKELIFRVSRASAFLPPTPEQLLRNPQVDGFGDTIVDPRTGLTADVQTVSGGNPDLKPQSSKSFNAGLVWEPTWRPLVGLRLNAEYYKIEQFRAIGSLSAQAIVTQEVVYPDRVIRDASGVITQVDTSFVNLYKREAEGWDLSVDYTLKTGAGRFNLRAVESITLHLKEQYSQDQPAYDAAGYHPTESGSGGAPKYKSNANLTWDLRGWTAGWTTRYLSSYKQYGAAGGPTSLIGNGGAPVTTYILPQGGDTISSQMYHDVFVGYAFGQPGATNGNQRPTFRTKLQSGITMQFGVRNVFNKVAPFDVNYASNYYQSPFGDMQMRTYWLSLRKTF